MKVAAGATANVDAAPAVAADKEVEEDDVESVGAALFKLNKVTMPVDKPTKRTPPAPELLCAEDPVTDNDRPLLIELFTDKFEVCVTGKGGFHSIIVAAAGNFNGSQTSIASSLYISRTQFARVTAIKGACSHELVAVMAPPVAGLGKRTEKKDGILFNISNQTVWRPAPNSNYKYK